MGCVNQKREPFPCSDSTPIVPPRCSMILLQIDRPKPVPFEKMLGILLPVMDALRSVTSWAAYQACEERIKGSLEPGKLADFVILEANPLTVAKETIKDIGISATIVGDEVVYGSLD